MAIVEERNRFQQRTITLSAENSMAKVFLEMPLQKSFRQTDADAVFV